MATWHGYLALQQLDISDAQAKIIWDQLKQLGPPADPSPARRCHWRRSLDGRETIFEAAFNPARITINRTRERLADVLSIDPATIDHATQATTLAGHPVSLVTFTRGTDRLRLAVFGTLAASWEESRAAAQAYVQAHPDDWEPET